MNLTEYNVKYNLTWVKHANEVGNKVFCMLATAPDETVQMYSVNDVDPADIVKQLRSIADQMDKKRSPIIKL